MPLRLDVKRRLTARSDRVKCVDLHPQEPWLLVALYSGTVNIWNYENQQLVRPFEVCDVPVRAARFIARKNWLVTGSDDMQIRCFNYNTLERQHAFDAHSDYIRCIVVHPAQPYILTCSDDMLIKLWNWEKGWTCQQVFDGHCHYVMQIALNPKDPNTFASASLDHTVKVWQLGGTSGAANFTLEGHDKGVNCVAYYPGADKPYIVSGADDRRVKIWDYQNKSCVQTLEGHTQNISAVVYHPELPILFSGSEDGTLRVWHANTYRLENNLNYGLERVWTVACLRGTNNIAVGYDEGGVLLRIGREEPAISMDAVGGKIIWARHADIQQCNLKSIAATTTTTTTGDDTASFVGGEGGASGGGGVRDGERLPLHVKDMGACDIFPHSIQHSPNGRFVVVCGDGEYIIYTAMALRNKAFGAAQEFVWAADSSEYAIREANSTTVRLFKNFKEKRSLKTDYGVEQIFGGHLLGVRSSVVGLTFYDWDTLDLVRRIETQPRAIYWSDNSRLVALTTEDSFFILSYDAEAAVAAAAAAGAAPAEDGIEAAFTVIGECAGEVVRTAHWIGDCFIYTNAVNRINYYVGGELVTIAHLDRPMYVLGYVPKEDRLYLADKELGVVSYQLLLSVLEYQTAVMREDFKTADAVLPQIPREHRTRVAHFLEKRGFKKQALAVTTDADHKFELALATRDLVQARHLAVEAGTVDKWQQLAVAAANAHDFSLNRECMQAAADYAGLLLLATSLGDVQLLRELAATTLAEAKYNMAFLAHMLLGELEQCLDILVSTGRLPEAAFFARTYLPDRCSDIVGKWKAKLAATNEKMARCLADPTEYPELFSGLEESLQAQKWLQQVTPPPASWPPAKEAHSAVPNLKRNVIEEMKKAMMPSVTVSDTTAAITEPKVATITTEEDSVKVEEEISKSLDDLGLDLEGIHLDDNIDVEGITIDDLLADNY